MSDPDPLKFCCEECGVEFDPDPAMMLEGGISPEWMEEQEVQALESSGVEQLSAERLESMSADELAEYRLTPEDRDKLISGESIPFGMCLCLNCQDEMLKAQEGFEE